MLLGYGVKRYKKLTDGQWAEIKVRHLNAETKEALAEEFGIHPDTIKKRCESEQWPTATNLRKKAESMLAKADALDGQNLEKKIKKEWGDRQEKHRQKMWELLSEKLENMDAEEIKIKSAHDLERVDAVMRRTLGLESEIKEQKEGNTINFNHFQSLTVAS